MLGIFFIYHLIMFVYAYYLKKIRQYNKSKVLFLINIVLFILNMITLLCFKTYYSTVLLLEENIFIKVPYCIINILYIFFIIYMTYKLFMKERLFNSFKYIIYSLSGMLLFILLNILLPNISVYILFITCVILIIYLINMFIKTKRSFLVILLSLLIVFFGYSFFTYKGSARLLIMLMGYPMKAYNVTLEEVKYLNEENVKRYIPVEDIIIPSGKMNIIRVNNNIVKIAFYEGI